MGRPLDEDIIIKILERWQKAFKENSHYVSASDLSLVIKDVRELPTIQSVATDTNVGDNSEIPNSSDTISRQAAIDIFDDYNIAVENGELEAYSRDRKRLCELPPIQPETPCYLGSPCEYQNPGVVITQPDLAAGEWIVHLYKFGVSRCECDACHARCDIVYPYCPYCGEKKEGERYANN